ncbi:MAG: phosphotransferase [Ignavibacteria bacterium]|nr:phosphotransferase [Ignavibacteria bacterium]
MQFADLHTHTIYSDGVLTPEELLVKALKCNLAAISITDHDAVEGCRIAIPLAKKFKLEFVTGIEFSCYEDSKEYHILGYAFDIENEELNRQLVEFRKGRELRAVKIVEKLKHLNVDIPFEFVLEKAGKAPIARPHIAEALLERGYIKHRKEAFANYIGDGGPCYEPKLNFTVKKGIELINDCGGVAVLAHPGTNIDSSTLFKFIKYGLDGIETIHPSHSAALQKHYQSIAHQYWLLETGGSDFHGNRDYDEENFGKSVVPFSTVESINYHKRLTFE